MPPRGFAPRRRHLLQTMAAINGNLANEERAPSEWQIAAASRATNNAHGRSGYHPRNSSFIRGALETLQFCRRFVRACPCAVVAERVCARRLRQRPREQIRCRKRKRATRMAACVRIARMHACGCSDACGPRDATFMRTQHPGNTGAVGCADVSSVIGNAVRQDRNVEMP